MSELTIAITCYKRPELLKGLLESIAQADLTHVVRFVVSVDWHSDEMFMRMCDVFRQSVGDLGARGCRLCKQAYRLGIHNHNRWLINEAFNAHKAEAVVMLEEDCVVAPDALNFAWWALQQNGAIVNLGGKWSDGVRHAVRGTHLIESAGWAVTRENWQQIEPYWNGKMRMPVGWDWSLSYLCYVRGWDTIDPLVARVKNVGRTNGTYQTAADYDLDRANVVLATGIPKEYTLLEGEPDRTWPEWVKEEARL